MVVQNLTVQNSTVTYGQLGGIVAELSISRPHLARTKPKQVPAHSVVNPWPGNLFNLIIIVKCAIQAVTCEILLEMPYVKERKWTVL